MFAIAKAVAKGISEITVDVPSEIADTAEHLRLEDQGA